MNAPKTVSAESGETLKTLRNLWPYMWPSDRPDLRMRVVWATFYLVLSKIVLILVPYFFKWVTNALNGQLHAPDYIPVVLVGAVMLVLAIMRRKSCRLASTSFVTHFLPVLANMRCASLPTRPLCICMSFRCAFIWSGARAACRASSSAAPRH